MKRKIVLVISYSIGVFVSIAIYTLVECLFFQHRYTHYILENKSCDYVLPKGISIVYSEDMKMYAVRDSNVEFSGNREYLICRGGGLSITNYSINVTKPCMFIDSCQAKNFAKRYIQQKSPKISDLSSN